MLSSSGHLKIVDFGLAAKIFKTNEPMSPAGSLIYLAPEMLRDRIGGRHTDWWATGILAHELLTGYSPWSSLTDKELIKKEIQTFKVVPPQFLSTRAGQFICSLLRQDYRMRLGTRSDSEVRSSPFFKSIDWEATAKNESEPAIQFSLCGSMSEEEKNAALDEYIIQTQYPIENSNIFSWNAGLRFVAMNPEYSIV